jgi:uncharacterized membrane protein YtjA (UPF0391 family)
MPLKPGGRHLHSRVCPFGIAPAVLRCNSHKEDVMLYWAAVFFVIALIAAFFGFGGIAASAVGIAKILFVVFLVLAVLSFLFRRRAPIS